MATPPSAPPVAREPQIGWKANAWTGWPVGVGRVGVRWAFHAKGVREEEGEGEGEGRGWRATRPVRVERAKPGEGVEGVEGSSRTQRI